MANYVLHAKILNGKDLVCEGHPADELNTFVRLHIKDRQQFYKTENKSGPNPEWNETLNVKVYDPEKDELELEVLQQDINTDVEICDHCLLSLDQIQVGSGANFEANLDLFKDDQPVGHVDIQLNLRPKDATENISFNGPVLLRINITEASGVTVQEEEDESEDTYLTFLLQGHDESEKIKSIVNKTSDDPAWNQSFSIICNDPEHDIIHIQMVSGDTTIIQDDTINVGEMEPGTRGTLSLAFEKGESGGHLGLDYESIDLNTMSKKPVKLHLKVIQGKDLKELDATTDPFVKASVGDKELTTEIIKDDLDPVWNQEFDFVSTNPVYDNLTLQLYDKEVAVKNKLMDTLVFPIRDLKTPEDGIPILYDVPLRLNGEKAGHLQFEILAQGECLRIQRATSSCIIEFTVLEATFKACPNPKVTYGLLSHEEDEPKEAQLNQRVSIRCDQPDDSLMVVILDPETDDNLCDNITIPFKDVSLGTTSELNSDTKLDDEVTGHVHIIFTVKDIEQVKKEVKEAKLAEEQPVVTQERSAPILDDYCDFQWGTYGSSYSTSFTGYSNCTPLSSTISDAEIKYHHRHPVLDQDTTKPKRRSETFSGKIKTVELDSTQQDTFVVGDKYYATAILYGKSSRSSNKFGPIQSEAVEAKEANSLSFNKFAFDFDKKLKKGDYIEVNLYHQSDNKQIAKSTIALEKVEQTEEQASNSFPLQEYKLVKNPAKIGTLKADLKHTIQFQ